MAPQDGAAILASQKNEITEFHIYRKLAEKTKDPHNRRVLERISADEKRHYSLIRKITGKDVSADGLKVAFYVFLAYVFGLSFSLKLMEKGEKLAQDVYGGLPKKAFSLLLRDEQKHERELLDVLSEQKIEYAGSIVLGLNDALVELTGALAGLTLAFGDGKIIAMTGCITGFAASLSMAASAYLSVKEDKVSGKNPLQGAIYTGITYLATVVILVIPFILIRNVYVALATTLATAILIVAFYTFYITTAKSEAFWGRFLEMVVISLTVAAISFGVGFLMKSFFGISV